MAYTTIKIRIKNTRGFVTLVTPAPPIGPAFGMYGINTGQACRDINSILNSWRPLQYSRIVITVKINLNNKTYTLDIHPTLVGRILGYANRYKGTGQQRNPEFYLTTSQIKQIAIDHRPYMNNNVLSKLVSMVRGTLKACGGAEQEDGTIIDDEIIGEPIVKHERKYKAILTTAPYSSSDMIPYLPILLSVNNKNILTHEEVLTLKDEYKRQGGTVVCYYNEHPSKKHNQLLYDIVLTTNPGNPQMFRRTLSEFIPDLSARATKQIINNIPSVILSQVNYFTANKIINTFGRTVITTNPEIQLYNTYIPEEGDVVHIHPIYVKLLNISKNDEYSQLILRNILEYFNYTNELINDIINNLPNNLPLVIAEVPDYERDNIISMISELSICIDDNNYLCTFGVNSEDDNSILFNITYNFTGIQIPVSCNVVIESFSGSLINFVKYIKELAGLGLREAKDFVENLPRIIKEGLSYNEACWYANNIYANNGYCTVRDENDNIVYNPAEEYINFNSPIPEEEDDDIGLFDDLPTNTENPPKDEEEEDDDMGFGIFD